MSKLSWLRFQFIERQVEQQTCFNVYWELNDRLAILTHVKKINRSLIPLRSSFLLLIRDILTKLL